MKQETLKTWNAYVQATNARLEFGRSSLFRLNEKPDERRRLRQGEILVSSVGHQDPKPIPSGLIDDWKGTSFIPNTTVDGVFAAVRDYDDYKDFYKPTVVDSKLLATDGGCDTYSMRVVDKEVLAKIAFDIENRTCYFRIDQQRWYSVTHTKRVQEILHYGMASQEELPPDQGGGYLWRLYSISRFEQKDGGVYVEVEAIALSRDIPFAVRWLVNPIVRRISINSMFLSLQQTGNVVRLMMAADKEDRPPVFARDRSPGGSGSKVVATNRFPGPSPGFTREGK
ncbi:MAG: hypothetical protein WBW84_01405 [Acidobacteriaceae bacterium]